MKNEIDYTKKKSGESINEDLQKWIDALPHEAQDDIFRYLWGRHVTEDVISHAEDLDIELEEAEAEVIAEWYVYDGKYDCTLDYWTNLENLINRAVEQRESDIPEKEAL